jgi:hypothetical protein
MYNTSHKANIKRYLWLQLYIKWVKILDMIKSRLKPYYVSINMKEKIFNMNYALSKIINEERKSIE